MVVSLFHIGSMMKKLIHISIKISCILVIFVCNPGIFSGSGDVSIAHAEDVPAFEPAPVLNTPVLLWDGAVAAQKAEDLAEASRLFFRYYDKYRQSEKAEDALWQAAQAKKQLALVTTPPEWEEVRNLFRMYSTDFPETERSEEAYFEIGETHYRMKFYREALIYFKLFEKRYPDSSLMPKVRYWQGKTLATVGRFDEAAEVYQGVLKSKDRGLRIRGMIGLGETYNATGKNRKALQIYLSIMKDYPKYYYDDLDLLINLGTAYLKVGKEKQGREQLFYYLNMAEHPQRRIEVLFDLAESYHRLGEDASAQKLYGQVIEEGKPGERPVVLALFRQAEFLDDPDQKLTKWQRRGDLSDPAGDAPYLAVLNNYHAESIAQDARRALFLRYQKQEKFEYANEVGKSYLRNDAPGLLPGETKDFSNVILLYLAEELSAQKEFEKLFHLYEVEHRHVKTIDKGHFLFLVGQALEALSLFDQAGVVYYRALALPISDKEKVALYFRRAEVYLAQKDIKAADRLLKYLRDIYKDTKNIGETYLLSGRLSEMQGRSVEALNYYSMGASADGKTLPKKKSDYAQGRLRQMFKLALYDEMLDVLSRYREEQWLAVDELQSWYRRIGDELRRSDDNKTFAAYLAAVGENMPQQGEAVQHIHLNLGDMFCRIGEVEKGRDHLFKAQQGPDVLLKKRARERLNQIDIDQGIRLKNRLRGNS